MVSLIQMYKEQRARVQKNSIAYGSHKRAVQEKIGGSVVDFYSGYYCDDSLFEDSRFQIFFDKVAGYLLSNNVKEYLLTISYSGVYGCKIPSAILFFDNEVKFLFPKMAPACSMVFGKIEKVEEFAFSKQEIFNFQLISFRTRINDFLLGFKFKKKGLFQTEYNLIIHEYISYLEAYCNPNYGKNMFIF